MAEIGEIGAQVDQALAQTQQRREEGITTKKENVKKQPGKKESLLRKTPLIKKAFDPREYLEEAKITTDRRPIKGQGTEPLILESKLDGAGKPNEIPGKHIGVYTKDKDGNLTLNEEPLTYFDEKKKALIGKDGNPIRELQKRKYGNRLVTEPAVDNMGQPVEDERIFRSPTSRLIRASLAATLKDIRHSPEMRVSLLPGFVAESRKMADNLDKLDFQFNTTGRFLDAGKGSEKRNSIYAVTLDLREPSDELDTRIPWVMIGGSSSTSEQNAALSMALALQGEKVYVLTTPDQMKEEAGGRSFKEKYKNAFQENFTSFRSVIEGLGVQEVNLVGHSLGGGTVLALAADKELEKKVKVHDVLALSPGAVDRRSILKIGGAFVESMNEVTKDPEAKVMMLDQGHVDAYRNASIGEGKGRTKALQEGWNFLAGGRAAASRIVTPEKLASAAKQVTGDIEIWTGVDDPVIKSKPIKETVDKAGEVDNLSLYLIDDGSHHTPIANAFGLLRARENEKRARAELGKLYPHKGKNISVASLEVSGAEYLLKQMKSK